LKKQACLLKNIRFATITNDRFYHSSKHYVTLFVVCDHEIGTPRIKEPDKCEKWIEEYSHKELMETAFKFENQLMELLGDC